MPKSMDAWGIEVGANALKAMRLVRRGDEVILDDYEVLPFKRILTTPDLNVAEAIQVNLDQFLNNHNVARSTVVVSVPGHSAFARFAKLPPVEAKRIPDIVRYEAVQQIPFPIEDVEWDYQIFQEEDAPEVEVGIFAITKARVREFLANYDAVGMHVDGVNLSPMAVYNALNYDLELANEPTGTLILDIGTSSTDIVVAHGNRVWPRTLPIGGNNFTEALVRSFKLSFPKAEKLKREARTSKYARQIFQAMRPVFADLVQELNRSLGYYQSMYREAELNRIIGLGSTFRLPGMTKFLKQQMQMDVVRLDGFKRLKVEGKRASEFADHAINMATAYGLALQGLEMEAVNANLMPRATIKKRVWRKKQPWIGAAAVLMMAASTTAYVRLQAEKRAYAGQQSQVDTQVKQVQADANDLASRWDNVEKAADPVQEILTLSRMLDYRNVWPSVLGDLSELAQAFGGREVLYAPDYQQIRQIPRHQRQRLYIEQMNVEFLPGQGNASRAWSSGGGQGRQQGRQPQGRGPQRGQSSAEETPGLPNAPKFRITITGYIPYEDAPGIWYSNLRPWFEANAQRPDRPYRILPETVDEGQGLVPREGGAGRASGDRTGRTRPQAMQRGSDRGAAMPQDPGSGRNMRPEAGRGGYVPPQVGSSRGAGVPIDRQGVAPRGGERNQDALLPQRPLQEEDRSTDWRFELSWVIELLPPDEARASERPELHEEGESDDAAAPGVATHGQELPTVTNNPDHEPEVKG